jgi:hypothetical protein
VLVTIAVRDMELFLQAEKTAPLGAVSAPSG